MSQKSSVLLRSPTRGVVFEAGRQHSISSVKQQGKMGVRILWRWYEVSEQMPEKTWAKQGCEEVWRQMG